MATDVVLPDGKGRIIYLGSSQGLELQWLHLMSMTYCGTDSVP